MTSPEQLVPAAPVPGLTLTALERRSPLVVELHRRIGAPHGWPHTDRTAEGWERWFAACPDRTFWLLDLDGEPAGIVSCDPRPGNEVEIDTFGLVPEYIGRGLGGYALTLGVRCAWAAAPGVTRVWLHTSSVDHGNALPNYHRRGLRTFRTETRERG